MAGDPRYTWAQQYLKWWPWTPKWVCPDADDITLMPREGGLAVVFDVARTWPEELADVPVRFGGRRIPHENSIPGKPVQLSIGGFERWNVIPVPSWGHDGVEQIDLPRPANAPRWVQGYPNRDGAYDRHAIIVGVTGLVHETILTNRDLKTCARYAVYRPDGTLVAGRPVTRGGYPQFRTILGTDEPLHRLSMSVPDYSEDGNDAGGPTDGTGKFPWPKAGSLVRLRVDAWAAAVQQGGQVARVAEMARRHGVWVTDRSGVKVRHANINCQAGAWDTEYWPGWTLADFEAAVGMPV